GTAGVLGGIAVAATEAPGKRAPAALVERGPQRRVVEVDDVRGGRRRATPSGQQPHAGEATDRATAQHARRGEQMRQDRPMKVHLVDGTYELFRHFYGMPEDVRGTSELGGVRGVVDSVLYLLEEGATHVGVATDHVIESFRNELWPTYKSSAGMDPAILAQFEPLEACLDALGVTVWPMVEVEADDALASAASIAAASPEVQQAIICTPDKDLAQCVRGDRVIQFD